jgi:hypothetical protein
MGAIVFSSAGSRKYHFNQGCKAFESAQMLSDLDCGCDTYCNHRMPVMHGLVRMSATKAAIDGKLPCLACVPEHLREMPDSDDFGHRPVPVTHLGNIFTRWSNCQSCHDEETEQVCIRCVEFDARQLFRIPTHPVHWPCTSAIVLGLAERGGVA